jgi:uncharacterized phage-like protein YoqJ
MILAVTGHRPNKLGGYATPNPIHSCVVNALADHFRRVGPEKVICGMALGVDQWAAQICCDLGIPWVAAVPFHNFAESSPWPYHAKAAYARLIQEASEVVTVTDTRHYEPRLLQARNEWMVNHSDHLVAVWNGSPGGTRNCINYATTRRKPWTRLDIPDAIWAEARRIEFQIEEERNRRVRGSAPNIHHLTQYPQPRPAWLNVIAESRFTPEQEAALIQAGELTPIGEWTQSLDPDAREPVLEKSEEIGLIKPDQRFMPARLIELDDD